jgi:hypothetical protein
MSSCVVLMLTISLISCGGSDSPAATGTLNIILTDAATSHQAVYVTINEVHVHHETGGWETLPELDLPQTVNLLELVNGVMLDLGIAELEAGHYNQMRLILEDSEEVPDFQDPPDNNILGKPHPYFNYLIDANNEDFPLKVPSGGNTGIKLVNGFDIVADRANELHLDFDAHRSIVEKGNGNYGLKPTIKVLETVDNTVSGTVQEEDNTPLGGALVSAQLYNPDAEDLRDAVFVESTTTTVADTGAYTLFLPLNTYNIVATAEGYLPACKAVEAEWYFDNDPVDLTLIAAVTDPITISGTVSGLATDVEALLSIRQRDVNCGGSENVTIEVASKYVGNEADFEIIVPAGTYDLVVSADKTTQVFDNISTDVVQDIDF